MESLDVNLKLHLAIERRLILATSDDISGRPANSINTDTARNVIRCFVTARINTATVFVPTKTEASTVVIARGDVVVTEEAHICLGGEDACSNSKVRGCGRGISNKDFLAAGKELAKGLPGVITLCWPTRVSGGVRRGRHALFPGKSITLIGNCTTGRCVREYREDFGRTCVVEDIKFCIFIVGVVTSSQRRIERVSGGPVVRGITKSISGVGALHSQHPTAAIHRGIHDAIYLGRYTVDQDPVDAVSICSGSVFDRFR